MTAILKQHFAIGKKGWLAKGLAALLLPLLAAAIVFLFGELYDRPAATEHSFHTAFTGTTPLIKEGDKLSFSFVSPYDTLRNLAVYLHKEMDNPTALYVVRVYEEGQAQPLAVNDFFAANTGDVFNVLPMPLYDVKGKTLRVEINLGRTTEQKYIAFQTMSANETLPAAQLNGQPLPGALAVDLNTPPAARGETYKILLTGLALLIAAALLLLGRSNVLNTFLLVLAFGAVFSILIPAGDAVDEPAIFCGQRRCARGCSLFRQLLPSR